MSSIKTDSKGNVRTSGTSGTYFQAGPVRIYGYDTAITSNSTDAVDANGVAVPAGHLGVTLHATGIGKIFRSDGTKWQFAAVS